MRLYVGEQILAVELDVATHILCSESPWIYWYDAMQTDPLSLSVADLAIPAFLGAVPRFSRILNGKTWTAVQASLDHATLLLNQLSLEDELAHWEDTQANRRVLRELFRLTTGGANGGIPGFGPACCTKMLHKKRPHLIPILDRTVMRARGYSATRWRTDDMVDACFAIGRDVAASEADLRILIDSGPRPVKWCMKPSAPTSSLSLSRP
ncbi:MAG: DUF6308 family protein [Actinomycetia bacterium]|nr:DUF6308 family protein [Actinomycetes bacterium]